MQRRLICYLLKTMIICASSLLSGSLIAADLMAGEPLKKTGEQTGKFQTSENVRASMAEIRKLVTDNHSLVTHRRMPVTRAQKMAKRVLQLIEEVRNDADLKSETKDALEKVIDELALGVRAIAGTDKTINPIDGIVLMDEALSNYAKNFEHPGWKGIREL